MATDDAARMREIEKDLTGRLFTQYEAKNKSFRATFNWLLTFAGFFLVFVVLPFMSIQYELLSLPRQIARLETEIKGRGEAIAAVTRSHDGFVQLREDIGEGPQEMRAFLITARGGYDAVIDRWRQLRAGTGTLPAEPDTDQFANAPMPANNAPMPSNMEVPLLGGIDIPPDCVAATEDRVIGCLVADLSRDLFRDYRDTLETEVLQPLEAAGLLDRLRADRASLSGALDQLEQRLEERLRAKPDFWHSVDEKSSFFQAVGSDMEELWGKYDRTIEGLAASLQDEEGNLRQAQADLDGKRGEMSKLRDEFKSRLKEIETPFGRLPVGLNEALLGFPVLLAVGFLVCAVQLADARRLRLAFAAIYRRSDPGGTIVGEREIALVAPLWPAPERSGGLLLMLAPFLVFAIAVGVVLYSWRMTDSFRAVGSLSLGIFFALYAVSLIAFLLSLRQVFRRPSGGQA